MYVIFRDDLISSDDIRKEIEENSKFRVITDLSKASKREDVMSFKLAIKPSDLEIDRVFDWDDDSTVDEYFEKAESLTKDFLKFFPKYTIQASSAYKWDEVYDEINLVLVISNIDLKLKKLELDILPRMLKQVD